MPQSREDRIYLAYKARKKAIFREQEGTSFTHFHAVMFVCKRFNLSYLAAQNIVNSRRDSNALKNKK